MNEITVSTKGQIVLPKELRDKFGWAPGTKLEVVEGRDQVTLRERSSIEDKFPPITWNEFEERRVKIETPLPGDREIDEILLAEAARRFDAKTGR